MQTYKVIDMCQHSISVAKFLNGEEIINKYYKENNCGNEKCFCKHFYVFDTELKNIYDFSKLMMTGNYNIYFPELAKYMSKTCGLQYVGDLFTLKNLTFSDDLECDNFLICYDNYEFYLGKKDFLYFSSTDDYNDDLFKIEFSIIDHRLYASCDKCYGVYGVLYDCNKNQFYLGSEDDIGLYVDFFLKI